MVGGPYFCFFVFLAFSGLVVRPMVVTITSLFFFRHPRTVTPMVTLPTCGVPLRSTTISMMCDINMLLIISLTLLSKGKSVER